MNWNSQREEERILLYMSLLPDSQIGMLSTPRTSASSVCAWRRRRGFPLRICKPVDGTEVPSPICAETPSPATEEEPYLSLYDQGLNDGEIAKRVGKSKTTVRMWRLENGLSPNAIRGGQPVQTISRRDRSESSPVVEVAMAGAGILESSEERPEESGSDVKTVSVVREKDKERMHQAHIGRLAEEQEEGEITASLPTEEEVYQKVVGSPEREITTEELIREGYGDMGRKTCDTVRKLRNLVKRGFLDLDTEKRGRIVWKANGTQVEKATIAASSF